MSFTRCLYRKSKAQCHAARRSIKKTKTMMTVIEQRFMERVPNLLSNIETALETISKQMSAKIAKNEPAEWEFDEQTFIERYCPMEGGNDYLGWIDDICKLLDGEAEPGDAASTGEYAGLSEPELRKELKRLTAIVLHQAVDRYVEQYY